MEEAIGGNTDSILDGAGGGIDIQVVADEEANEIYLQVSTHV
jgi:hypothetical protein